MFDSWPLYVVSSSTCHLKSKCWTWGCPWRRIIIGFQTLQVSLVLSASRKDSCDSVHQTVLNLTSKCHGSCQIWMGTDCHILFYLPFFKLKRCLEIIPLWTMWWHVLWVEASAHGLTNRVLGDCLYLLGVMCPSCTFLFLCVYIYCGFEQIQTQLQVQQDPLRSADLRRLQLPSTISALTTKRFKLVLKLLL